MISALHAGRASSQKVSSVELPNDFLTTHTVTESVTMLRTALFQSARRASRLTARTRLPTPRAVAPCFAVRSSRITPSTTIQASRWYSAPAGLSQQEVEGRIMDLLKNFDKVRSGVVDSAGVANGTDIGLRRNKSVQASSMGCK